MDRLDGLTQIWQCYERKHFAGIFVVGQRSFGFSEKSAADWTSLAGSWRSTAQEPASGGIIFVVQERFPIGLVGRTNLKRR